MRKIIVSMYVTLYGVITRPIGELDKIFKVSYEELDSYEDDLLNTVDVILLFYRKGN